MRTILYGRQYNLRLVLLQVNALCLVNCVSTAAGWIEWGYQKLNARHLSTGGMTQGALDYLLWHHFGKVSLLMYFPRHVFNRNYIYTYFC